jgi:hypothetical protein
MEGCDGLSPWVSLILLAHGERSRGHEVFHYGALFELVFDRVRMVWIGHFEKFREVLIQLSRLVVGITLGGRDILLIGAVHFPVVLVITVGGNCDRWGCRFCPFFTSFGTFLGAFAGSLGWCPSAAVGVCCLIGQDKDVSNHIFTRSVSGGDIKQLLRGL